LKLPKRELLGWRWSDIQWQQAKEDGTKTSFLQGNREAAGQFTYALYLPPGYVGHVHHHSGDLNVALVRGEFFLGMGSKFSRPNAKAFSEGSYLIIPADAPHYEFTKRKAAVLFATAVGPWVTTHD